MVSWYGDDGCSFRREPIDAMPVRDGPMQLTAVFVQVPEGGYVAFVEELPGAKTQGSTLEEARENLREAVILVIECNRELADQA